MPPAQCSRLVNAVHPLPHRTWRSPVDGSAPRSQQNMLCPRQARRHPRSSDGRGRILTASPVGHAHQFKKAHPQRRTLRQPLRARLATDPLPLRGIRSPTRHALRSAIPIKRQARSHRASPPPPAGRQPGSVGRQASLHSVSLRRGGGVWRHTSLAPLGLVFRVFPPPRLRCSGCCRSGRGCISYSCAIPGPLDAPLGRHSPLGSGSFHSRPCPPRVSVGSRPASRIARFGSDSPELRPRESLRCRRGTGHPPPLGPRWPPHASRGSPRSPHPFLSRNTSPGGTHRAARPAPKTDEGQTRPDLGSESGIDSSPESQKRPTLPHLPANARKFGVSLANSAPAASADFSRHARNGPPPVDSSRIPPERGGGEIGRRGGEGQRRGEGGRSQRDNRQGRRTSKAGTRSRKGGTRSRKASRRKTKKSRRSPKQTHRKEWSLKRFKTPTTGSTAQI